MDPDSNTVLALANWPRVDANDRDGAPDYAAQNRAVGSTTSRARRSSRSPSRARCRRGRHAGRHLRSAADDRRRRPHDQGGARARNRDMSTTQILAQSSNVGTVRSGCGSARRRFDRWVRAFGFGRPTGIELPGEESGLVLKRTSTPARRWATCRSARASRSRRSSSRPPTRRSPTAGSCAGRGSSPRSVASATPMPPGTRVITSRRRPAADDARGVVDARRHGSARRRSTATRSPARPAPRRRSTARPASTPRPGSWLVRGLRARPMRMLLVTAWSTSRRARSSAARSPPRHFRIMRFALPYLGVAPAVVRSLADLPGNYPGPT